MNSNTEIPSSKKQMMSLLFGGLIPVIAFTLIEEQYGTVAGLIAGMIFGVGEIIYERLKYKKVSGLTWFGNGLLIGMGVFSLYTNEGIWFKLQPAIMEFAFAIALIGSWLIKRPVLRWMMLQQNPNLPTQILPFLSGMTFRLGLFFLIQAALATYAALYWSTTAWAFLKGVGILIFLVVFMLGEGLWMRLRLKKERGSDDPLMKTR